MANRGRPRLADYVKADRQRLKAEQKAASARAKAERKELLKSLESELHDLAKSYAGPTRSSYTEKGRRWKESVCYGLGQDYKDIGRSFRVVSTRFCEVLLPLTNLNRRLINQKFSSG